MAKFRHNHTSQGKGLQTSFRLVIFFIIAVLLVVGGGYYFKDQLVFPTAPTIKKKIDGSSRTFLPSATGQIIHHTYYSLSYVEKYEQAEWTAYVMNRNMLNVPNVDRSNHFNPDYSVTTRSAFHRDYSNSGYTRGHLTPAGDMAFDTIAMRESFYMSNMSPQLRAFNNGVWKELEENVRDWTYHYESLYIITGPIIPKGAKTIGNNNKIAVPDAFFKIVLDYNGLHNKMLAFIIPNQRSEQRLETYAVSVDEVEKRTNVDFFNEMIDDQNEEKLESGLDLKPWKISDKRYQLRISQWNNE